MHQYEREHFDQLPPTCTLTAAFLVCATALQPTGPLSPGFIPPKGQRAGRAADPPGSHSFTLVFSRPQAFLSFPGYHAAARPPSQAWNLLKIFTWSLRY